MDLSSKVSSSWTMFGCFNLEIKRKLFAFLLFLNFFFFFDNFFSITLVLFLTLYFEKVIGIPSFFRLQLLKNNQSRAFSNCALRVSLSCCRLHLVCKYIEICIWICRCRPVCIPVRTYRPIQLNHAYGFKARSKWYSR